MKVASFVEDGNVDEIDLLLANEMKAHGNEADVMLCMKVIYFWKIYENGCKLLELDEKMKIYVPPGFLSEFSRLWNIRQACRNT